MLIEQQKELTRLQELIFLITFYEAGFAMELRAQWRFLQSQPESLYLYRDNERRDLFAGRVPILAC